MAGLVPIQLGSATSRQHLGRTEWKPARPLPGKAKMTRRMISGATQTLIGRSAGLDITA